MIAGRKFIPCLFILLAFLLPACAQWNKWMKPSKPKAPEAKTQGRPAQKTVRTAPKPVDTEAQQRFYNQGLKYYSDENYLEAKKAWQQVLQLGPNTPLAEKARDYLKKTDQVLKTLNEMERK